MQVTIQLQTFIDHLVSRSNEPLDLAIIMKPMGIELFTEASETLLVAHLLDHLVSLHQREEKVDLMDIALAAWELGYLPAGPFIDSIPDLVLQSMLRKTQPANLKI